MPIQQLATREPGQEVAALLELVLLGLELLGRSDCSSD